MSKFTFFRMVVLALVLASGSACQPPPIQSPTPAPTATTTAAAPVVLRDFRSTSGQTFIQYYTFTSGTCGTGSNCSFRGIIHPPAGYDQSEVFLSGFSMETQNSVDKVQRISA